MSELDAVLSRLREHEGVEHLLLVGSDGLLIQHAGDEGVDAETVAALAPTLSGACASLGEAAAAGRFATAAVEWNDAVGVLAAVTDELLVVVLLQPDVGFAELLRALRAERDRLAELV